MSIVVQPALTILTQSEIAGLSIAVNTEDERVINKANYHLKGDLTELKKLILNW